MSAASDICVRPFEPRDQDGARRVVLEGMRERWGTLDETLNPDLSDIERSYADGAFFVAEHGGAIVGTGGLLPRGGRTIEIVRMSTLQAYRRRGVARLVLTSVIAEARRRGSTRVVLATNLDWREAILLYESFGMRRLPVDRAACFELLL